MVAAPDGQHLEERIADWRGYLRRRQAIHAVDVAELEDHLREQVAGLRDAGLSADEAFLVAVKRMGALDSLSREFAREHSERLWKQLVVTPDDGAPGPSSGAREAVVAVALGAAAALALKVPELFGLRWGEADAFYLRNVPLLVLPFLMAFFAWKRRLTSGGWLLLGGLVAAAAVLANLHPFTPGGSTEMLAALHLPIALWLVVGVSYAGGQWRDGVRRMDFIRFTGEQFIYFVLIGLGGGVLMAFMAQIFGSIGLDVEPVFERWLLPSGAAGGLLVAAWLVEAKQSVIENMAPVLTRLFTPLFTVVLLVFLGTLLATGRGVDVSRDVLIAFDGLLVLVLALVLYSVSARDPQAPPGGFDLLQVVLVASALAADLVALWAMAQRIQAMGITPNRVAAVGVNAILLVNLGWTAVLQIRFLRGRGSFAAVERWQTGYVPVYGAWAVFVILCLPPLFRYA